MNKHDIINQMNEGITNSLYSFNDESIARALSKEPRIDYDRAKEINEGADDITEQEAYWIKKACRTPNY